MNDIDNNSGNGLVVVISGPSGVGKTTITRALVNRFNAVFSVSATTRPKTQADVEGKDYHFLSTEQFERKITENEFLEYAKVFDHYYGTPRTPVLRARDAGRVVILEIDIQGALQIRKSLPDAFMIFILPPSEEDLLERLRNRKREPEEIIARRFREAQHEMKQAKSAKAYDLFIVNDDLDRAIAEAVRSIEEMRNMRARQ